jgi:hypothetical protein
MCNGLIYIRGLYKALLQLTLTFRVARHLTTISRTCCSESQGTVRVSSFSTDWMRGCLVD